MTRPWAKNRCSSLQGIFAVSAVVLQALLGAGTVLLIYALARRLDGGTVTANVLPALMAAMCKAAAAGDEARLMAGWLVGRPWTVIQPLAPRS